MTACLARADRGLRIWEGFLVVLAAAAQGVIALLVLAGILSRSFPAFMVPDNVVLVRSLLLVSLAFALGEATRTGANITVDLLADRLGPRARRILELLGALAGLLLLVPLAVWLATYSLDLFHSGRTNMGLLRVPQWPTYAALCLGFATMSLRLCLIALAAIVSERALGRVRGNAA
ncbi:TRAP-type mannitol/chloroaromatic compound transport system, small permease component [Tistlia consotensis]|uniref:TRAP transporter small permease protein n=1 Tax=Tistlia consotensis USBA 355 TaxID=560819 RepID=A0A1Y6CPF9_9PROT|nr:TRAP transporter small permease subunit [Tistlia consotensis]SMF66031.1 TRAP-type mannitol/chloroaromatic compound transport system, small permease component [Tistlia consotensis USBA 355]SNS02785.1 TRAP-type mannitol/chloroaromatic compound transport system, small permease component [Tistlia consotensis]